MKEQLKNNFSLHEVLLDCVPKLRCYAWAVLSNNDVVKPDDLVELCLLEAKSWSTSNDIDSPDELQVQIFKILHGLCAARLRDANPSFDRYGDNAQDGGRGLPDKKDRIEVELRALPSDQRAALMLVSFVGFSYNQAAGVLDIPVAVLRTRLTKARETLYRRRRPE